MCGGSDDGAPMSPPPKRPSPYLMRSNNKTVMVIISCNLTARYIGNAAGLRRHATFSLYPQALLAEVTLGVRRTLSPPRPA